MQRSTFDDAFGHHVWATLTLIDACAPLTEQQLAQPVPGTYGSILDTMRHVVGSDAWYLFVITGGRVARIDEDAMSLAELRAEMERHGAEWTAVLRERADPDEEVVARRDDGTEGHAPIGIRLAQVVHHGTDHRSQVCTGLTSLGITPPEIDVWDFGMSDGRVFDTGGAAGAGGDGMTDAGESWNQVGAASAIRSGGSKDRGEGDPPGGARSS